MKDNSELKGLIDGAVALTKIAIVILMVVVFAAMTYKAGSWIWTGIVG